MKSYMTYNYGKESHNGFESFLKKYPNSSYKISAYKYLIKSSISLYEKTKCSSQLIEDIKIILSLKDILKSDKISQYQMKIAKTVI